ncbi:MAG: hypothetical protein CMJ94_13590 [Planctomycetes bacterium]|nr:hypothetical protein [Planctomycetota bacterium]
MDQQRGIGRDGDLAWRLPEDLKWFRAVTVGAGGQSVIMGRKTWDSIPDRFRPLPERENWVLTRQPEYAVPSGVRRAASLDQALAHCEGPRFVIGGGSLYAEALQHPSCTRIYLTVVEGSFDCDTFLAEFGPDWQHSAEFGSGEHEGIRYRFEQWDRVVPAADACT